MNSPAIDSLPDIAELNEYFRSWTYEKRLEKIYDFFDPADILVTSSFGTKSVFLLHLISQVYPDQKIYFIDTTYHFPETLEYKKRITERLGLQVIDVLPNLEQNDLTRRENWWIEHPKMCCTINKISPLEPIIAQHKLWIAGLMGFQTEFRSTLDIFNEQGDIIKFHPLINLDEGEFLYQMGYHRLPPHPLEEKGYGSIGCLHCTEMGEGRSGRWKNRGKSECGLHPNYFIRKSGLL